MDQNDQAVIYTLKSNYKYRIRRRLQKVACHIFGFNIMTKIYYRIVMHQKLNLRSPKLYSEKICWYKLNYCPTNKTIINCADKYLVRKYLEDKGLREFLPELIGVWTNTDDIIWDELPEKFALKCSHGSGFNIICLDKKRANELEIKKKLNKWLKDDFGYYNAEPHYNYSDRRIICEKYIDSKTRLPIAYKVHCLNGKPITIQVCSDRGSGETKFAFCDLDGKWLPYTNDGEQVFDICVKNLKMMKEIAEKIAADFPLVRVDFYKERDTLKIGELTFVKH